MAQPQAGRRTQMEDNQIFEEELEYILPDDYEEEPEEDTTEAEETEDIAEEDEATKEVEEVEEPDEAVNEEVEEETEEVEEVKATLDDLEVKFLHDTKKLKDFEPNELKTIVQKGLNHDRLLEKVSIANERIEKIKELSELYNMNESELVDALFDQYFTSTAEREGKDKETIKLRYEAGKKEATQKMYERFNNKFPGVKAEEIPQNVWQDVEEGADLIQAFESHIKESALNEKNSELNQLKSKIEELEKKLSVKTTNEKVKKKAVVKPTSTNGNDTVEGDDFLSGFFGK